MNPDPASNGWHLDKRVPIALILVLVTQLVGGVWFASQMSFAVNQNANQIVEIRTNLRTMQVERDDLASRIIRIEEKISNQNDILRRIEQAVSPRGN